MQRNSMLILASTGLLMSIIIGAALAHQEYIDACVCVVNSISRATVVLALSVAVGLVAYILPENSDKAMRVVTILQVVLFIISLFFVVQHIFFVYELA